MRWLVPLGKFISLDISAIERSRPLAANIKSITDKAFTSDFNEPPALIHVWTRSKKYMFRNAEHNQKILSRTRLYQLPSMLSINFEEISWTIIFHIMEHVLKPSRYHDCLAKLRWKQCNQGLPVIQICGPLRTLIFCQTCRPK